MSLKTTTLTGVAVLAAVIGFKEILPETLGPIPFVSDTSGTKQITGSPLAAGTKIKEVAAPGVGPLPALGEFPSLAGATGWLNSEALSPQSLKGKVVLVNFWTFACGDCVSALPTIKSWAEAYKKDGLVVVGVHSPEFAFEKKRSSLEQAVSRYGVDYPVAIDNDFSVWKAFENVYWPEQYVIDADGIVRYHHLGAADYNTTQAVIEALLKSRKASQAASTTLPTTSGTAQAAPTG
ncbi:redoxin family protein [Rhizobium sp. 2MFCol3.1]|uniref:redoxin family protein n=1 Tax=Rhizobium sp. 2MFCol3.1 TaxID=1246459 RepID=UPI0009DB2053|nr:redoxin family protein [Rhizobium sp. 2MFCol3.1]